MVDVGPLRGTVSIIALTVRGFRRTRRSQRERNGMGEMAEIDVTFAGNTMKARIWEVYRAMKKAGIPLIHLVRRTSTGYVEMHTTPTEFYPVGYDGLQEKRFKRSYRL